jgi:pyridoxal phosphate enzyme (YggS family)
VDENGIPQMQIRPLATQEGAIKRNVRQLLSELPDGVQLVAAAKTRSPQEILEAIEAGIKIIGENYVQEAEKAYKVVGHKARWHFIGHLQKNKVKKAIEIFDMIETVDSVDIASEIDKRCTQISKTMPVLVEINSSREEQKAGVYPENAEKLIIGVAALKNIRVMGLMTMGPSSANAEDTRSCFAETRKIFNRIKKLNLPRVEMKYLSMGMTDSYRTAIEEGANIVRIGSKIFGVRVYHK